jgi:ATP-dependent DNA ligase
VVGSQFYVYDCMVIDGRDITDKPYVMRLDEVMKLRTLKIEGFTVINSGKRFATDQK